MNNESRFPSNWGTVFLFFYKNLSPTFGGILFKKIATNSTNFHKFWHEL